MIRFLAVVFVLRGGMGTNVNTVSDTFLLLQLSVTLYKISQGGEHTLGPHTKQRKVKSTD